MLSHRFTRVRGLGYKDPSEKKLQYSSFDCLNVFIAHLKPRFAMYLFFPGNQSEKNIRCGADVPKMCGDVISEATDQVSAA